jgi:hypothetical protein
MKFSCQFDLGLQDFEVPRQMILQDFEVPRRIGRQSGVELANNPKSE